MKKKYFIYAILPVMTFAVMGAVYANSTTTGFDNKMSNLVNAIAERFNLNVSDVQQVFDEQKAQMDEQREEQKTQMEVQREQAFTDRINQAVTDGNLTQDQADKILAKKAELEAQQTSWDSLKQWATDNNIPQEYLPFLGFGGGRGHGGFGGPGGPEFNRPAFDQPSE